MVEMVCRWRLHLNWHWYLNLSADLMNRIVDFRFNFINKFQLNISGEHSYVLKWCTWASFQQESHEIRNRAFKDGANAVSIIFEIISCFTFLMMLKCHIPVDSVLVWMTMRRKREKEKEMW